MLRLFRLFALFLGAPLALVLIIGITVLGARVAWVVWFPSPPPTERMEEKLSYLHELPAVDPETAPSFVVILFDDLGWGDLSSYGNPLIETPHIDRAAREGLQMTRFFAASPVCTPSRAALLTGRYPPRHRTDRHVFFPDSSWLGMLRRAVGESNEIPRDEVLLPEALQAAGYATAMMGKWHLGAMDGHRPNDFGFDHFFGVLWSNDMFPLHLYRDDQILERDERPFSRVGQRDEERALGEGGVDQSRLTERYTDEAIEFLEQQQGPFFLYLAHTFPHVPHYAAAAHAGASKAGLYGDVVEDLDRSTGRILDALRRLGLDERTLVLITSDNGADYGGSPGPLRGRKGETYDGGQRVPLIARWRGRIPSSGRSDALAMNIDLFPTLLGLAGLPTPDDREIDGRDLSQVFADPDGASPHEALFYFPVLQSEPVAVQDERFRYRLSTGDVGRDRPHLTLAGDNAEAHDLRRLYPDDATRLDAMLDSMRAEIARAPRGWR